MWRSVLPVSEGEEPGARALRRAVMAQTLYGRNALPMFFPGMRMTGRQPGLGIMSTCFSLPSPVTEARIDRVAVMAPGLCDRSIIGSEALELFGSGRGWATHAALRTARSAQFGAAGL